MIGKSYVETSSDNVWLTEKPKEPGYYWFFTGGEAKVCYVTMSYDEEDACLYMHFLDSDGEAQIRTVEDEDCLFSKKIVQPEKGLMP